MQNNALLFAHPLINEWFNSFLGTPTDPQIRAWPIILAQKSVLISAPTGSGKTLAAFLPSLDLLARKAIAHELNDETVILYISPLKALGNDVQKNILQPLHEITELAKKRGYDMQEIRVFVRTGDTLAKDRTAALKKPPHILITTPESFYILLTAEKSRERLVNIHTVIVDEIHAMVQDKRGSHLMLSLERLEKLVNKSFIRIGLSATQKPLQTIANFLVGAQRSLPEIIDIGHARHLDLAIEVPDSPLSAVASNEMWDEIYDKLVKLAEPYRSTLVFVNTRRMAERVAHHLGERLDENIVGTHHGSLSRKLRLQTEMKLKSGELKILVATASLELGIDIGNIDLVCQIGSPRTIATLLQRVGRAGHWHGAISRGRLIATTRDELLECAALLHAIKSGDLDSVRIPGQPLDILAQQIIASCATHEWQEKDLYELIKNAYPYQNLSWEKFMEIIEMLASGIAGSRGRYGVWLFRDQVNGRLKARRGARISAIMNGGAIPENGLFTVIAEPQHVMVGTLDEDFAVESMRGDIFLLGTTSWQINRVDARSGKVLVHDAKGAPPSIPFWRGEAPARSDELSLQVSALREFLGTLTKQSAINWLQENCGLNEMSAQQLMDYLSQGKALLGEIPSQKTIIAERFFDESGGMQLVIHSPFGARINKAWGLALRKRFCRSFNFELQAAATDDGLIISLAEQHSFPLADVFHFLHPATVKDVVVQAVLQSPIFKTRWRWTASRALALLRFHYGYKIPPAILRMRSDDLLAAVFPDAAACQDNMAGKDITLPDHPLVAETMKDILNDALDLNGLIDLLQNIHDQKIKCFAIDTPLPSVFAQQMINANAYAFLDDAPLEERRARAVEMRRYLPDDILQNVAQLDNEVIEIIRQQAWPDVRDADELHDVLQTMIVLPEQKQWENFFAELVATHRASEIIIDDATFWVAAEKWQTSLQIYPQGKLVNSLADIENNLSSFEQAIADLLRGWLLHLGPTTSVNLAQILGLPEKDINQTLIALESSGFVLRGHFSQQTDSLEWCERRLLARIHRLTIDKLRKAITPVTDAEFQAWLLRWQHIAPESQLQGEHGLLEIIKQLQGVEMPAHLWEQEIFSKRVTHYQPELLDKLTTSGSVGWGRFSARAKPGQRIRLTRNVPVSFFIRGESSWYYQEAKEITLPTLSHVATDIYNWLKQNGASFFMDMAQQLKHLRTELENGLLELTIAGLVSADNFDDLRSLINKRHRSSRRRSRTRPMLMSRWSILSRALGTHEEKILAMCWILLKRYGVVYRELLDKEKNMLPWRVLLPAFRQLEARGEIRGGLFVSGVRGEQFALPYAVESLRTERNLSYSS